MHQTDLRSLGVQPLIHSLVLVSRKSCSEGGRRFLGGDGRINLVAPKKHKRNKGGLTVNMSPGAVPQQQLLSRLVSQYPSPYYLSPNIIV